MLCGCFSLGPNQPNEDQIGYSRALSEAEKRQTLLNVVRLRYADMPTFLDATQVIAGYQLQRSVNGGFELFPHASISTYLDGGGTAQFQESPTFTLQPVTGEHFAQSFLQPLSAADLLPLAQGGLPIDVLFRLAVQSIGPLNNSTGLVQGGGAGSPGFSVLLHDLRRIQIAGFLGVRLDQEKKTGADGKSAIGQEHVYLTFSSPSDPQFARAVAEARRLLGMAPGETETEVVYGRTVRGPRQIAMLTRSMLGVLGQLAFQAQVPVEDVAQHQTLATVGQSAGERRPVVLIHSGKTRPADAFTSVEYNGQWFWLDKDDFDSKVAFSMVNILLALAKTSSAPGTVITIPAG